MKKIYSFLMACVLGASALTATAERTVTAMISRGAAVTSPDQITPGKKSTFPCYKSRWLSLRERFLKQ